MAKIKKELTTADKLKIINSDPEKWLFNMVKIVDSSNKLVPFQVNKQQKHFLDNMDKFNIILKSRQLGFSTLSLGLMLYNAYQIPNSTYLMVAHNKTSLRELFNKLKLMQNSIPKKYRLAENKNNRDELELSNGSRIIVQNPGDGLGAGMTLNMVHLSEYALYSDNQQEMGLVTVESSLVKNESSRVIIESTARGIGNHHFQIWQESESGRGRYKPFFFPWTNQAHLDLFRYEVDMAVDWWKRTYGKGKTLTADPLETTSYEKTLLEKTDVTLLQLMWRQWKLTTTSESLFMQDFPAFPQEAFISSNSSVYDADTILQRMYHIPKPLKVVPNLPSSLQVYLCNGLNIYQLPKPGEWYFGGVDTALGVGGNGDFSSVCILDSDGEQVATFNRNDIPTYRFTDIINDLGNFFNTTNFMVERNSYGIDILQRLHKEKLYQNLSRTRRKDKITGKSKWSLGWYNDSVSKTILVNDSKEAFETGTVLVNDKSTLEQMRIYTESKGSFGNKRGEKLYDDLVDALALAIQSLKLGRYHS